MEEANRLKTFRRSKCRSAVSFLPRLCLASFLVLRERGGDFVFQAAALGFIVSPCESVSAARTSTAAAAVYAGGAARFAAAASAANTATRYTYIKSAKGALAAVAQGHSSYFLTNPGSLPSYYGASIKTEPRMLVGSLECSSNELNPSWNRQRARILYSFLTPEVLSSQEKADEWSTNKIHEGDMPLEQQPAATSAAATKTRDYSWGTRKSSYSRVRLVEGCGRLSINGREGGEYLQDNPWWIHNCIAPLMELNMHRKYDVVAEVHGGGLGGQSGAIMLAVARAIVRQNPETRLPLRRAGFLTVDARRVERKKFGLRKARKREQYSKR